MEDNITPQYVIIHNHFVSLRYQRYKDGKSVLKELQRIQAEVPEQDVFHVKGNPRQIPHNLDPNRPIRVCGAFYKGNSGKDGPAGLCIDALLEELLDASFNASVHLKGTLCYQSRIN